MIKWAAYIDTWDKEPGIKCEPVEVTETAKQFHVSSKAIGKATGFNTRINKSDNILFDSEREALENLERVAQEAWNLAVAEVDKRTLHLTLVARALEECE